VLSLATLASSPARGQSTAFTYQGSLDDAGAPASGLHDLRFRLYSVASGGTPIGSALCVDNVSVVEGVFTAQIDFGPFATTEQRFLELEVRRDTGLNCSNAAGFVVMAPRQQLTATPMASHAKSAFALDAADGSPTSAVFVDNEGEVGIGTTSPSALLHVQGIAPVINLQDTASPSNQAGYISFRNSASTETGWLGYGTAGSPELSIYNARTGGDFRIYTGSGDINLTPGAGGDVNLVGGRVGVGTYTPAAALDVRGNIKLGSSGQYSALGGMEDLRLVRGQIDGNGTLVRGTGFTVSRASEGIYDITFAPPFSGIPTISGSAALFLGTPRWVFWAEGFVTASTARVYVLDNDGVTDSDFSICVIGPR
jgi:hypothetical protein